MISLLRNMALRAATCQLPVFNLARCA